MKTHSGFTLLEVLIAMLLLAIGLLGLAALQTVSIRNNLAAYNHGQATQLLYDMSDRIRANVGAHPWDANSITVVSSYRIADTSTLGTTPTSCTPPAGCTRTQVASNDLIEWNNAIFATLPKGRGIITASTNPVTDSTIFTLSITWDDDRSGAVDGNDPTFTIGLQL